MDIIELFNDKDINTKQPLLYRTYTTFLLNYTDISMLIDSSKSILLRTPSTDFVKVSGRLGVGIDPSNIYSLHVLGDTCISGSIISNGSIVSNGTIVSSNINKITTDISFLFNYTNDISTSLISLYHNVNDLSVNYYTFKNNTINDISKINTDISSGFKYSNDLSAILLDLSINHYTLKNSFIDLSSRHYSLKRELNDLSTSKASLQSEVNILTTNLISVSNELYNVFSNFIFSIKTGFWGTLEFIDNQEFIINDLQFRVEWLIEWPTTRRFRSNYYSLGSEYIISRNDRLYSLDSSLIIQVKSIYNNSFSTSSESETIFITQPNISISSELLNNDSIKQITLNLANIDTINNGLISIYYNPSYKGFFGTLLLTNNNAVDLNYVYVYNTINEIVLESSANFLTSNTNYSITISNEVRVKDNNTPLRLAIAPDLGYDISITALLAKSINLNIKPLRVFNEDKAGYILSVLPFNSNLENGLIGLSFEVYKTGFFGTFALANKTSGSRFDYSYNYISIKDSSINKITQTLSGVLVSTYSIINYSYNSGIQTLSGQELSNNSINSENRLAYADTLINLGLVIYNGYDISVGALPSAIVGISNNILTSSRRFNNSNNILYNYNIIPLSSYLVNGTIGLSFEMYRTGFFGTFALGNKTSQTRFDYSYNYISISGSNVISNVISTFITFTSITQISIPSNARNFGIDGATKFAKTTNNQTFKAAFGSFAQDQNTGAVYYWSGTTANNQLIRLDASNVNYLGIVVSIDNNGSYIVAGGNANDGGGGGVIWSTTPPYSSARINYPQNTSGFVTTHISGNGKRVFIGIMDNYSIYAYSHTDLSLTQIGGVITNSNLTSSENTFSSNAFSSNGFASDNSGNYLITSAYLNNNARGSIFLYRFTGSTWVQTHGFSGTTNNDYFGYSIDMNCGSGIVCCAGARNATPPYVKIYKRDTTTNDWTEFQTLNGTTSSGFGKSVSFNESGLILYVTTIEGKTFYYTRSNNSELFTLTSTIPIQEPIEDAEQVLSTNSSGNQVIIVKTSVPQNANTGFIYYFDYLTSSITTNIQTLSGQELKLNNISSANRLAYANSSLNLSLVIYDGYDISVGALPSAIIGISNNSLTTASRRFDTSNNILYNYNIIPLTSYLFGGTIGVSFEMYRTGFFGTFALGNKTSGVVLACNYNYISISGTNVNSEFLMLNGVALSNNNISGANRLADANSSLNLGLVISDGYDISVGALPSAIIGISNNILTSSRQFNTSNNILYNYNIIPLTSFLLGGTIGVSFEMYRTGFFGTFALGNKTTQARFDYSYNYISISGSNVNSIVRTLSGQELSNNSISSANRVAYADSLINLGLVIYNGYDISVGALPSAIIGISNNILTNYSKTFNTSNNILYNYNIIPLSSYLFGGTIGLSFEMYRTGFFGQIIVNNNLGYTIDYSYNYITLGGSTIFSPSTSINNTSSNSRTISGELRLREASSQITTNIRTSSSVSDISYSISGGTINNIVVSTSSPYKYLNFNILPNVNNLVNGTLTFNTINVVLLKTGWYGIIYMKLYNGRNTTVNYTYTIYKGSTTGSGILDNSGSISNSTTGSFVSSLPHQLSIGDRLANSSSSFLVVRNSFSHNEFIFYSITNATISQSIPYYTITPLTTNEDITITFSIETP